MLGDLKPNSLSSQFRTRSPPNTGKHTTLSSKRTRGPADLENVRPEMLNSPPLKRMPSEIGSPYTSCDRSDGSQIDLVKRQNNPTRSPAVRKLQLSTDNNVQAETSISQFIIPSPIQVKLPLPRPSSPIIEKTRKELDPYIQEMDEQFERGNVSIAAPPPPPPPAPTVTRRSSPFKKKLAFALGSKASAQTVAAPKQVAATQHDKRKLWAKGKLDEKRRRGSTDHLLSLQVSNSDHRTVAATEMYKTESRFWERLQCLMEVGATLKGYLSADQWKLTFSSLLSIASTSAELLANMRGILTHDSMSTAQLGHLLIRMVPFMKNFQAYVVKYKSSQEFFVSIKDNKNLISKLDAMRTANVPNGCTVPELQSWLAEPMQRIMRYSMLVEAILSHTPNTHVDYPGLEEAAVRFKALNREVNEEVRSQEQQRAFRKCLAEMHMPDQELIAESQLGMVTSRKLLGHGVFSARPLATLQLDEIPEEPELTSTDALIRDLDVINSTNATVRPTLPVNVFAATLDTAMLPRMAGENSIDPELAAFRLEAGMDDDVSLSGDSEQEDEPNQYHILLSEDVLITAFRQGDRVAVQDVIPLQVLWVVEQPNDVLVLVWPGGTLCLEHQQVPSRVFPSLAFQQTDTTVTQWKQRLASSIHRQATLDTSTVNQRRGCSLYVEDNATIRVEEAKLRFATQDTAMLIANLELKRTMCENAVLTPKKQKKTFFGQSKRK